VVANSKLASEEILLLISQKKDEAFSYLYDQYAPALYGIISREVNNVHLSKAILKSSFIKIFHECSKIDSTNPSFFMWMLLITKRTAAADFNVIIDLRSNKTCLLKSGVDRFATIPNYVTRTKTA